MLWRPLIIRLSSLWAPPCCSMAGASALPLLSAVCPLICPTGLFSVLKGKYTPASGFQPSRSHRRSNFMRSTITLLPIRTISPFSSA